MKHHLLAAIVLIGISTPATAQTYSIAHKSHSGAVGEMDLSGPDRFGECRIPITYTIIEQRYTGTDTLTIISVYSGCEVISEVTLTNDPYYSDPDLDMQEIIEYYDGKVQLRGFHQFEGHEAEREDGATIPFSPGNGFPGLPLLLVSLAAVSLRAAIRSRLSQLA